jgi:hypothetical protein
MTQQLEVLQLALQALRYHTEQTRPIENTNKVIAIIQEELGFFECNCNQGQVCNVCDPIYPVSAQPAALYTSPPQRQPLTDEEIRQKDHYMIEGAYHHSFKQGVRWAERKHGITGEQK